MKKHIRMGLNTTIYELVFDKATDRDTAVEMVKNMSSEKLVAKASGTWDIDTSE